MTLVLVGVNPQLRTVAVHAHFALRANRFYPAVRRTGVVDAGRRLGGIRGGSTVGTWSIPASDHASGGVGAERADELGRDELVAGAAALGPTTPAAAGSRAPQTDARCGSTPDPVGHYLGGRHGAFPAGRPIVSLDGMGRRWCRRCEE